MPGLTFLNLAFLAGLAAAAVPILIHLFSRRRSERQPWASVRFLKELYSQRVRRVKLRQLLLLLLRVMALLLFVLAMMRPTLTGNFLVSGRAPSTVCLVVDTSYSMQAARAGQPTFESARARAGEIVDLLNSGDEVYVIAASDRAESATPYPMQDLLQVRGAVAALQPTERGGDLRAGLDMARRLLRASKNLNKEIYVVTDMQQRAWQSVIDSTATSLDLPAAVAVCVIGASAGDRLDNVTVHDVRTHRQLTTGGNVQVEVALANHTRADLGSVPIDLEIDGRAAGQSFVDLPASSTVRTHTRVQGHGWSRGWGVVNVPEDALGLDDRRYFVLGDEQRAGIGVLAESDGVSRRAATFLRLAIEPDDGTGSFSVRDLESDALRSADLADLQVVIVAGVERMDHGSVELVKNFVRNGGGLLIFPGERSDLRFYNDRLLNPFLPVKIASVIEADETEGVFRLTPAVPGHPVFAGFRATTTEQLTRARFNKVIKVVPGDARVLARFRRDLPALIEGDGVLLFASSIDRLWNDFPTSGAFVPLLHQIVAYLSGNSEGGGQAIVGSPVERLVAAPAAPSRLRAEGPDGDDVPLEVEAHGDELLLLLPRIEHAGIYRVKDENGADVVAVAVNLDPVEGDLELVNIASVARVFEGHPFAYIAGDGGIGASVRSARYGRELWRFVLFLSLVFLVAEVFASRGKGSFTPSAS